MVSSELISVGKRIHERQQAYLFAAGQQALGYLEYYQPPERAANQGIRAFWFDSVIASRWNSAIASTEVKGSPTPSIPLACIP